jgi:hypothetical protein
MKSEKKKNVLSSRVYLGGNAEESSALSSVYPRQLFQFQHIIHVFDSFIVSFKDLKGENKRKSSKKTFF